MKAISHFAYVSRQPALQPSERCCITVALRLHYGCVLQRTCQHSLPNQKRAPNYNKLKLQYVGRKQVAHVIAERTIERERLVGTGCELHMHIDMASFSALWVGGVLRDRLPLYPCAIRVEGRFSPLNRGVRITSSMYGWWIGRNFSRLNLDMITVVIRYDFPKRARAKLSAPQHVKAVALASPSF